MYIIVSLHKEWGQRGPEVQNKVSNEPRLTVRSVCGWQPLIINIDLLEIWTIQKCNTYTHRCPTKFRILCVCLYISISTMAILIKTHLLLTCLRSHSHQCYLLCQSVMCLRPQHSSSYFPILLFFHCFCHCDLGYDVKYYKLVCWCRCWSIWIGLSKAINKNKNKRKKRRTIVCGKKKKKTKKL